MAIRTTLTLLLALTIVGAAARADTLLIEGLQENVQSAENRPTRGMTMERVETVFGAPSLRGEAVGDPPITRWEYPGYVVYFENNLVLHSVIKR